MKNKKLLAEAYVSLMVYIAKAEGLLDVREQKFIYDSTKGYLKRFGIVMEKERVDALVQNPISMSECIHRLKSLQHSQKISVVMQLVLLSYAHETVSEEEYATLKTIIAGLYAEKSELIQKYIDAKIALYSVEDELYYAFSSDSV